jgi:ferric-chelate reductase
LFSSCSCFLPTTRYRRALTRSPSVLLIAACIHTTEPGFNYYVWPVWVVWGFERTVRALRYLALNVLCLPRAPAPPTAQLTLVAPDTVRVALARRMPPGWAPGQHAFLHFPSVSAFWGESHPFSIASVPGAPGGGADELVFLVRARSGATRRMAALAARKPGVRVPVNIDAPYGRPTDLGPYRTCVLVAGGTGVTYTLPLLLDLVKYACLPASSAPFRAADAPFRTDACPPAPRARHACTSSGRRAPAASSRRSRPPCARRSPRARPRSSSSSASASRLPAPAPPSDAVLGLATVSGRPDVRAIVRAEIERGAGPLAVEGPCTVFAQFLADVSAAN